MKKLTNTVMAALLLAVLLSTAGCGAAKWKYDPITDMNNLEGRRIGVNLAWESDYYLSARQDMEIIRYDTTADLILALKYNKIDAIALDIDTIKLILCISDGVEVVEPPFAVVSSLMYFGGDDEALAEEFNAYLAEYKQTEEYADLLARLDAFDGIDYVAPDSKIPLTGSGETIRVIVDPANFPRAFLEPGESIPTGYDLEILKHFANDRNYRLEFALSGTEDGLMGLLTGRYDVMTGYLSDVYAEEAEAAGLYTCDAMFESYLHFLQKNKENIDSDTSYLE